MKHVSFLVWFYIEMLFPIWYHLYNLKNLKNTYGGVSLLVKLQASGSVGVFYVFSTVQMLPNCGPSDEWWVNQYLAPVSFKNSVNVMGTLCSTYTQQIQNKTSLTSYLKYYERKQCYCKDMLPQLHTHYVKIPFTSKNWLTHRI